MYDPADPNAWVWLKPGDCRDEAQSLYQRCQEETRGSAADIEVKFSRPWTILIADGPWWQEQMRVHPNGWQGGPLDDFLDFFQGES